MSIIQLTQKPVQILYFEFIKPTVCYRNLRCTVANQIQLQKRAKSNHSVGKLTFEKNEKKGKKKDGLKKETPPLFEGCDRIAVNAS